MADPITINIVDSTVVVNATQDPERIDKATRWGQARYNHLTWGLAKTIKWGSLKSG